MNRNIIGLIIVLALIAGGWYLLQGTPVNAPGSETTVTNQMPVIGSTTPEMIVENTLPAVTVTYTDAGFSPKDISVPVGTTINFVNKSKVDMWVASAMHPSHTVYSGTDLSKHCPDTTGTAFDECKGEAPGTTYSFTFSKEGVWKYHDHITANRFGSITVTAAASSTPL